MSRASAAKRNEARDPAQESHSAILLHGSRLSLRSAGKRTLVLCIAVE